MTAWDYQNHGFEPGTDTAGPGGTALLCVVCGGTQAGVQHQDASAIGTVVARTEGCEIRLSEIGFHAQCVRCGWISESTHSKSSARMFGVMHDEDPSRICAGT